MSTREHLDAEHGADAAYPEHLRAQVEDYLERLRFSQEPATQGLEEAMRYSLLAGGKRIRPVLALATATATGFGTETVLPLAAALELGRRLSGQRRAVLDEARGRVGGEVARAQLLGGALEAVDEVVELIVSHCGRQCRASRRARR